MLSPAAYAAAKARTAEYFARAGIVMTSDEIDNIEIADFGLADLDRTGLQIVTYINTERVCAKEMVLFPGQTCPEHKHISSHGQPGKEETFRCRYGQVKLYLPGGRCGDPAPPDGVYTVFREIVLDAGEQYTIYPGTLHWFQAGPDGAVISEFSTRSTDETDVFSDPDIRRAG